MDGICTLANDKVYDQVIALLNSIEVILGQDFPVCIYPYNDQIEKIASEIAHRPQVQIYDDQQSIERWDNFFTNVWNAHPSAHQYWQEKGKPSYYQVGRNRRFCAFDGPFDRFLYMDADTLLMDSPSKIFDKLNEWDWVVYDFQYKDLTHIYNVNSPKLTELFDPQQIQSSIFCSGFYASRKGIYSSAQLDWLLEKLREGETEVLYIGARDQPILNYMAMRSNLKVYNFSLNLPPSEKTGNSVTSTHFEDKDHILYDHGNRLTYVHYIGIPAEAFTQVCQGINTDFPYRDTFLYYRYLKEPEKRPKLAGKPQPYNASASFLQRVLRKLKFSR